MDPSPGVKLVQLQPPLVQRIFCGERRRTELNEDRATSETVVKRTDTTGDRGEMESVES